MQARNHFSSLKTKGFSLVEMMLVVAIGSVIAVAGVSTYDYVSETQKINESAQVLTQIYSNVRKLYIGQATFGAANINITKRMRMAGAIPDRYALASDNLSANGPFGAVKVTTAASAASATQSDSFKISFKDLPKTGCNTLVRQINPNTVRGLSGVQVGTDTLTDYSDTAIQTKCSSDKVEVIWTFK